MERHLERCLQSILNQTYTNLEILMIDDGSTDRSLDILHCYVKMDSRIHVFHKENGGVSSARNLGLKMMHGTYCTFIDPDDYVDVRYIEWLYFAVQQTNTDLSICNACVVRNDEKEETLCSANVPTIVTIPIEQYSLWGESSHEVCWGAIIKAELTQNIKFDESLSVGEDTLFFFQVLSKCPKLSFIKERPYYYVQYNLSATNGEYTPARWSEVRAWEKIMGITNNAPKLLRQSAKAWYLMTCAKILTMMRHSKFNDPEKADYLLQVIRKNIGAIWQIPNHKMTKKVRLLAYAAFPRLVGYIQWKYYLRKKTVTQDE